MVKYLDRVKRPLAEIDIFLGKLKGLVAVEFEFKNIKTMRKFGMPDFSKVVKSCKPFSEANFLTTLRTHAHIFEQVLLIKINKAVRRLRLNSFTSEV